MWHDISFISIFLVKSLYCFSPFSPFSNIKEYLGKVQQVIMPQMQLGYGMAYVNYLFQMS